MRGLGLSGDLLGVLRHGSLLAARFTLAVMLRKEVSSLSLSATYYT